MSWLDGLRHRLRTTLRPRAYESDLNREMQFHIELDAMQQGDLKTARRRFGNQLYYREETRQLTWLFLLDVLGQDAKYAWRSIARSPGVTALVVLTLALGVGVNGVVFTVLDRLYLRPPGGVTDPASVQRIWVQHFNTGNGIPFTAQHISYPNYRAIAESTGDASMVAVYTTEDRLRLGTGRGSVKLRGVYASANYFTVLGVRTAIGRTYTPSEDRLGAAERVVVLSDGFWRRQFGADSAVLGKSLILARNTSSPSVDRYTVIGVVQHAFTGVGLEPADVWLPLGSMPSGGGGRTAWWESANSFAFQAVRRVTPDAGGDFEVRATLSVRESNRRSAQNRPDTLMKVYTGSIIEARGPGDPQPVQLITTRLGAVALIVLLIACANVINLLLAQALQRRRETAVRLALGISRARLIRLRATESLIFAMLAAVAALFAAWWGGALLQRLLMPDIDWVGSALTLRVTVFTALVALIAGLLTGTVTAVFASNPQLIKSLKTAGSTAERQRSGLRNSLVVVQAAMSVMLLVGSTLFVRSLHNVQSLDIGFEAPGLLFGGVDFAAAEDRPADDVVASTMRALVTRLEGRPGIETVTRAGMEPMRGFSFVRFYFGADSSASLGRKAPVVSAVSPTYFQATGIRLLEGNGFTGKDELGAPPEVVLNAAAASMLWPGRTALGQCLRFEQIANACYTVVGVTENTRLTSVIESETRAQLYLPLGNSPVTYLQGTTVIVRARANAFSMAAYQLRAELQAAFPNAEPMVNTMSERLEPQYRPWRLGATLFTGFGMLALLVAIVGIYTTVSYAVTQRTQEFGLRAALGARTSSLLSHVVGDTMRTVVIGVVLGIILSLAAGRLIAALLYGIEPSDPGVLLLAGLTLLAVAALAALWPAWRAARVDPLTALRAQ